MLPPYAITLVHVFCRIFNRTWLTRDICVQSLDSAVLYAFLQLQGKATVLKHEKKAWLFMGLASYYLCYIGVRNCKVISLRVVQQQVFFLMSKKIKPFFQRCIIF